jgi:Flp pilus assembly protein TadG
MQLTRAAAAPLARLVRERRAVALTEFALAAPVMLLMGLGGTELAYFMTANLRVSQIAMSVADNAGRVRTTVDEADIAELMIGAMKMGEGIGLATNGRIILSDLEQRTTTSGTNGKGATSATNTNGYRQWIRWQRCAGALAATSSYGVPLNGSGTAVTDLDASGADHGAAEGASTIDGMGPAGNSIAAAPSTAVMVAEISYRYQPLVPAGLLKLIFGELTIRRVAAFNVRQRTAYSLRNDAALAGARRADCRLFAATTPSG